jgi:hypothetical protein
VEDFKMEISPTGYLLGDDWDEEAGGDPNA